MKRMLMGLAMVLALLSGCKEERSFEALAGEGRFLSEMLRGNEAARTDAEKWVDPATCRDSTDFICQMSRKRGMVATELPSWVCDWYVIDKPATNVEATVLVTKMGDVPIRRIYDTGDVVAVRRDGEARRMSIPDLRAEFLRFYGTTNGVQVGGKTF